ncbi:Ubiquitin-specific protease incomplete domain containing protein [Pandoravirus quercus]|uniref:Ubiquitin-specific protease incomplete domain containing protein n=2 Tax=Pandoravirus TaxID=2060084 RepID=A0A2U7U8L6_9VIRU|nr:Ubiquitin-specific protease incomplete domain containing protein [Pandoravirus quercus]AVK74777.1 Ubiquitin-specific protease incomplete domain containing protein [Pandoravirus quercus]QBZ80953.1 Ubiquitin-specific protease incomplete domain containing protein [Pandoravirus celtis]
MMMAETKEMASAVVAADSDRHKKTRQHDSRPAGDAQEHGHAVADTIPLNVGGKFMMTLRTTFAMAPPGSLLARMFGPDADDQWAPPRLPDGSYFLDLNPVPFAVVLDVLRHGAAILDGLDPPTRHMATVVADYLGLDMDEMRSAARDAEIMAPEDVIVAQVIVASNLIRNTFGLWRLDEPVTTVVLSRTWPMPKVRDALASALKLAPVRLVAHQCLRRINKTVRPEARLPLDATEMTLGQVYRQHGARPTLLVHDTMWLPGVVPPAALRCPAPPMRSHVTLVQPEGALALLFVKRFNRAALTLSKAVPVLVDTRTSLSVLLPHVRHVLGIAYDADMRVFEEVSAKCVKPIDVARTLDDNELAYGDILWVEMAEDGLAAMPIDLALVRDRMMAPAPTVLDEKASLGN